MQNFVYVIASPATKRCFIVDPHRDWKLCENDWLKEGYTLAGCLLTHSHHDHIAGLPSLLEARPDLPVIVGEGDAFRLAKKWPNARLEKLSATTDLDLAGLRVRAIHSPGHSAGEFCFYLDAENSGENQPILLTGDVLFIRQCGRTDLETGNDRELFETLTTLKRLPATTIILPGHHYSEECASTLGTELRESPPLLCRTWEELRDLP